MHVIVEDSARKNLEDIYYYNFQYSLNNAIETDISIYELIYSLVDSPYIGRYIPEFSDKHFRELIYKRNKHSTYRIMYYISENNNTVYVRNIINCRQDFNRLLNHNNYFKSKFI